VPDDLGFVAVIPESRTSTAAARRALPAEVPLRDAADTLANAVGLALALAEGRMDDLPEVLGDRLHEPYRGPMVAGIEEIRGVVDGRDCLGATISGSGPTMLLWCRREHSDRVADAARAALRRAHVPGAARPCRPTPVGVRARWTGGADLRLARAVG
jgi:homoserine kinase